MQKEHENQVLLQYVAKQLKKDSSISTREWKEILNCFMQQKSTAECAKLLQMEEQTIIKIYYQMTMELSRFALDSITK